MKNKNDIIFPVYEFRPDKIYNGKLLRYNNGSWIPDDGEYDLAFVGVNDSVALHVRVPYQRNLAWSWCKKMEWWRTDVKKHPRGNAWHYMSRDGSKNIWGNWGRYYHLNVVAGDASMSKCSDLHRGASGRLVEFNVIDPTIQGGLLRDVDTKEVVVIPDAFVCCYCGEHDWRKEDAE